MSVWSRNFIGHNEDVVSTWGVFVMSHIGYDVNVLGAIHIEAPLNQWWKYRKSLKLFWWRIWNIYNMIWDIIHNYIILIVLIHSLWTMKFREKLILVNINNLYILSHNLRFNYDRWITSSFNLDHKMHRGPNWNINKIFYLRFNF